MDTKQHIYKSNNLIECSYKLSLNEQRIIYLACKKLRPIFVDKNLSIEEFTLLAKANLFEEIEIKVSEFAQEFDIKSNAMYSQLKLVTEGFYQKEIVYIDDDENIARKRWLITSIYNDKTHTIKVKFHPDLVKDLLVFKGKYTKLNYSFLSTAKNAYSARVYELVRQYLKIGKREFTLDDLRFKLNLLDGEYPKYANLKQSILNPAKKWINDKSDIVIEFSEVKNGRKIEGIEFTITPKVQSKKESISYEQTVIVSKETLPNDIYNINSKLRNITGMNISAEDTNNIIASAIEGLSSNKNETTKSMDYIQQQWNNVKAYAKYNKVDNMLGCLITALRNNWGTPKVVVSNNDLKFNNFDAREMYEDEEAMNKLTDALTSWGDDREVAVTKED